VLDTLDKMHEEVSRNTIVVFGSDHGEMLQSHELIGKGHYYDESSRVPLFIRLPHSSPKATSGSHKEVGRVYRNAASLTDLYPTLIGLAIQDNDKVCCTPL
jgi:arylsulfatase A-like enzyme